MIYYNNKPLFEARYETVRIQRYRRSLLSLISFSGWTEWAEIANSSQWSSFRAHDAEFSNNTATNVRTMRFSSSTSNFWGNGSIPEIYQLTVTPENPTKAHSQNEYKEINECSLKYPPLIHS